ncbi:hypothetical protein NP493_466g02015 [Ridgeia piscesae]|uniref:CHHC U11-48K-type domain-containing protein n=1 Tax=Ridgeia piscesae TaxID=27915 RepID=A0AAD9KYY3_RIDPI|nr:hypothetical protein NP493_466g02015 [Ridgeia piscesae]
MAQYQLSEPDDLIECPYNSAHLVKALRFPYHLIKCRKNNPTMDYVVCPFNARHEMPSAELRYHIARCIDRTVLEQDLAHGKSI